MTLADWKAGYLTLSTTDKKTGVKWILENMSQYLKEDICDEFYDEHEVSITITNPSGTTPQEVFIRPIQPVRGPR